MGKPSLGGQAFESNPPFHPAPGLAQRAGQPISGAPFSEADQFSAITAAPTVKALASFGDMGAV